MSDDEQEKYVASIFVELIFYTCLVIYATLVCALNPSENICPSKWDLSQVAERSITKICWIRHLEYQSIYTVCIWTQIQNPKLSNYTPKTLCAFLFPKKTPITSYYIKSSLSIFQPTFDRYSPHDFQAESPEESYPTRTELQSINDMKSRCCDKQHLGLAFLFLRDGARRVPLEFCLGCFFLLEGVP